MLKRIIIGPAYPLRGGISESNQALSNYFQSKGEYCKIVSYSLQYPNFLFPGKSQKIQGLLKQNKTNYFLINTINPFSWFKTIKWILQEDPDYVVVRYWHPYFSICLSFILAFLRAKSIFIIAWIDNIEPHEPVPFQKILTTCFLKLCDTFVVMSQSVKKTLLNYCNNVNEDIVVCSHPIYNIFGKIIQKNTARKNLGLLESSTKNDNRYILFFGLIRKYKGLDMLLDVMALEKIKALKIKLIIAGEFYESKEKYLEKIKKLNISDSIILHDYYIPNKDVVNYFCASDIVVQPYISATQSGVSMIAFNFNKPVLLTNVGGLSEYINHGLNGYLVHPDIDAISKMLEDYYVNDREPIFSEEIKKQKSDYSWSNLAHNFDSLYKNKKHA